MNRNPIIIIDDDDDDLETINAAFKDLKIENEIIVFRDPPKFLDFLRTTNVRTFFILCDINLPKMNGLELKKIIFDDENLRLKCVPFIFMSTTRGTEAIMKAYSYGVQGYFIKGTTFPEIKESLLSMVNYWKHSLHPNDRP